MFITRATRHDKADVKELFESHGWGDSSVDTGTIFMARDGLVVGCVKIVEVAPQTLVVDDMLVREGRRGEGIGADLMRAAMNSRGGTMWLCCHDELIAFYERFGFALVPDSDLPDPVIDYLRSVEDYPAPEGHVHYFMKAR
ncbi:MAG TPA: GNAT family N-acetyltransferase [Actinomycetota bacterium]|jgi:predicted N-acetyltransferase YhbS|nr:GNAT family N-acetyltransferase [Actinomycetota bacterium]